MASKRWQFNTGISARNPETGYFTDRHAELVHPLIVAIRKIDGVYPDSVEVSGYSLHVQYSDDVISEEQLASKIQGIINRLYRQPKSKLFPEAKRTKKTPGIVRYTPTKRDDNLYVYSNTHILAYKPGTDGNHDDDGWYLAMRPLLDRLARSIDGITNIKIWMEGIKIRYNTNIVSRAQVEAAVASTLQQLSADTSNDFFPFVLSGAKQLELTFR